MKANLAVRRSPPTIRSRIVEEKVFDFVVKVL